MPRCDLCKRIPRHHGVTDDGTGLSTGRFELLPGHNARTAENGWIEARIAPPASCASSGIEVSSLRIGRTHQASPGAPVSPAACGAVYRFNRLEVLSGIEAGIATPMACDESVDPRI